MSCSNNHFPVLAPLEVRYPLPCINHANLFVQTGQIIDGLRDLFEFSYCANPSLPKVKTILKLRGRYNNHQDLARIEICLRDTSKRCDVVGWPISVMVYRGTQNLDNPTCVFRALDSATESISDYILRGLKERFGIFVKRSRVWEVPVTIDTSQINPNLPSVTGQGTIGSQISQPSSDPLLPSIPAGTPTPILGDLVTLSDFNQRIFALSHELDIGCAHNEDDCASNSPSDCEGGTDNDCGDDNGTGTCIPKKIYDADCIADVHKQLINFIDILNHAGEAELVSLEPKFMVATQYCLEDIPSDLQNGLVDGGIFTVLCHPIWMTKKFDRHTLAYLYASVIQKLQATDPSPSSEEQVKLNAQLAAITELLGTPNGNGEFIGGTVKETEHLFLDMADPSDSMGMVVMPNTSPLPGSRVLTTGVPIEFAQKFAIAATFEYQEDINRFKLRRLKVYHTETDMLVQRKLYVLSTQILGFLMDGNNDTTIIADNRETTMMTY